MPMRSTAVFLAMLFAIASSAKAQTGLGYLTKKLDNAVKNFDAADRNHDGMLSKEEAQKGNVPFVAKHFDKIDREHRGLVSKKDVAEYIKSLQRPASASTSGGKP